MQLEDQVRAISDYPYTAEFHISTFSTAIAPSFGKASTFLRMIKVRHALVFVPSFTAKRKFRGAVLSVSPKSLLHNQ